MIYKSRNGMGIRVMSITLLLFLILTNASEVQNEVKGNIETQLQECGEQICCGGKKLLIWNFESGKPDVKEIERLAKDAKNEIEKMIKTHTMCQIISCTFGFLFLVLFVLGVGSFLKKWTDRHWRDLSEKNTFKYLYRSVPTIGKIAIVVISFVLVVVIFIKVRHAMKKKSACKNLISKIEEDAKSAIAGKSKTNKKKTRKNSRRNTKEKEIIDVPEPESSPAQMELAETNQEDAAATIDYDLASETTIKETKHQKPNRNKNQKKHHHNESNHHAEEHEKNIFIYAMVILFVLFAICALCNFEKEEETGEITEV